MNKKDKLQLDRFDFNTNLYVRIRQSTNAKALHKTAKEKKYRSWRIWNLTKRADKPLLAYVRIVNTFNHYRRWSRVGEKK